MNRVKINWGGFYGAFREDFLPEDLSDFQSSLIARLNTIEKTNDFREAIRISKTFTQEEVDYLNSPFLDKLRLLPPEGGLTDNLEVVKYLIENGYKYKLKDIYKITPEVARFLLENKLIDKSLKTEIVTLVYEYGTVDLIDLFGEYGFAPTIEMFPDINIGEIDFRPELLVMYIVISKLQLWDTIRENRIDIENLEKIYSHPDVVNCGHSGYTESLCFKLMSYVAENNKKLREKSE